MARNNEIKNNNHSKMGSREIGPLLLSMAWPPMLSMSINALYNIVDSIFVAMLSEGALTAVSLVMPVQILMISTGVGSGIGVNSLIARRLGERNVEDAGKAASLGIRIGVFNYFIFAAVGLLASEMFVGAYTDNAAIYQQGVTYMRIICTASLFFMLQLIIEKILQATGSMVSSMLIALSGAVVNLILDPILIFGLLGMPKLGIAGAAWATVIGQVVAMSIGMYFLFAKDHGITTKLKNVKIEWKIIRDIYNVGLPSIVMQSIASVMILGYNSILSSSSTAVAVLGVYFKIQSFVLMPVFGLNQGAMPIMGFNYGAHNRQRLMETYYKALAAAGVILLVGMIGLQVFSKELLLLFSASENMLNMGIPALRRISLCFVPAAFGIMTATLFQATGYGIYSLWASIVRQLVGILPLAYVLYNIGGVNASWYSFPLSEILGSILSFLLFMRLYKRSIKTL